MKKISVTTEDAREILADAKAACIAAGNEKPTAKNIHDAIAYEHGEAFAVAVSKHNVYLGLGVRRFHESLYADVAAKRAARLNRSLKGLGRMIGAGGLFGGPR
jgi:hypothetical protein